VHVAQLAGVPVPVVLRAAELLARLETAGDHGQHALTTGLIGGTAAEASAPASHASGAPAKAAARASQLALFAPPEDPLRGRLRDVDVNALTPLQALQLLDELRRAAQADA